VADAPARDCAGRAAFPNQFRARAHRRRGRRTDAGRLLLLLNTEHLFAGGYSRPAGPRRKSTGSRVAGSGAVEAGPPPGRAAAISPYPPQYRAPADGPGTGTPQYFLGCMVTPRRTIVRPSRSSTVRYPSGPTLTKAVDKVRRPSASAGESASGPEAGPAGPGSSALRAAVSGIGLGSDMAASLGGGLQATSTALQGSKRQGITPLASLNTAFATRAAPASHRAGGIRPGRDRKDAEAAVVTRARAGDRPGRRRIANRRSNFSANFQWGYQ
jgi:hypothetical protein